MLEPYYMGVKSMDRLNKTQDFLKHNLGLTNKDIQVSPMMDDKYKFSLRILNLTGDKKKKLELYKMKGKV